MTAGAVLDDLTSASIREAMALVRAGRLSDACAVGEQSLASGGDRVALHAMLGMLRCRAGEVDRGIDHLRIAYAARPSDAVVGRNLAMALSDSGRFGEALDVLTPDLAKTDPSMALEKLRGQFAQAAEAFDIAIPAYERVVAVQPDDWEVWNNLGNARRMTGDAEGSLAALRRADALAPGSPPVELNLAMACSAVGNIVEGEQRLRALAEAHPADTRALRELHAVLKEQMREEDALLAIAAAVDRAPNDIELLLALASQRLLLLDHHGAEAAYAAVIAIEPSHPLANLGLAVVFELTNRIERLARLVGEAEARGASAEVVAFIRAFDARRGRRFEEGLAALDRVPDSLETARRAHLLGQLLDGVGRYDDAFAAFSRMNALKADEPSVPIRRAAVYREAVRSDRDGVTPEWFAGWQAETVRYGGPTPVFLIGFPRSGTTLLDTILLTHPAVEILEEEPALKEADALLPAIADLGAADDVAIGRARTRYFEVASRLTPLTPGTTLVDKNPLHMNKLPVILRLFPEARILLALRHPCDVLLSCFSTNFTLNAGMSNFLTLDDTAALYDLSFSYLEKVRAVMSPSVHQVVYENIVADRERELRALFGFIDVDWNDAVLDHQATARGRERIKTASYAQVVQPIYSRSANRWVPYRRHLEPVFPVLRPWAEKFGYEI